MFYKLEIASYAVDYVSCRSRMYEALGTGWNDDQLVIITMEDNQDMEAFCLGDERHPHGKEGVEQKGRVGWDMSCASK